MYVLPNLSTRIFSTPRLPQPRFCFTLTRATLAGTEMANVLEFLTIDLT